MVLLVILAIILVLVTRLKCTLKDKCLHHTSIDAGTEIGGETDPESEIDARTATETEHERLRLSMVLSKRPKILLMKGL